ncbi:MAG: FlaD/FlaE family flagellar protein, partial [archaeon]
KLDISNYTNSSQNRSSKDDLKHSLLELDTLNIEEAASDAVPLTSLKTNTNSLVIILSWLEYLVKRIGVEESKNILRYYTETLKWITPEVFFELDKFLKGMDDIDTEKKSKSLNVKDHIVSLYFISKLNEKNLDEKLTKAVLQIINNE